MMITDKALEAGAITQKQANELEDWIDKVVLNGNSVSVPDKFSNVMDICSAYNLMPEGLVQ